MPKKPESSPAQHSLREKFLRLMQRIRNVAGEYHRRFNELSDAQLEPRPESVNADTRNGRKEVDGQEYEPSVSEWESIKDELQQFSTRTATYCRQYDSLIVEIRASGDARLKEQAELADATGVRKLLGSMDESLADQLREAQAPLSDEQRKLFLGDVRTSLVKARLLRRIAEKLVNELGSPATAPPPEQATVLLEVRKTLGRIRIACVNFAANARRDRTGSETRWIQDINEGWEEFERDVEALKAKLVEHATRLRKQRASGIAAEVEGFAARLEDDLVFEESILEFTCMIIGSAIRLPKKADAAADKLLRKLSEIQQKQSALAAECSAARGKKDRQGDLAEPESLRTYDALTPKQRCIVDFFLDLSRSKGHNAAAEINEIVAGVKESFRSHGFGSGKTSIQNVVRDLASSEECILLATDPDKNTKGHGGKIRYRLTVPAMERFSPSREEVGVHGQATPPDSSPADDS